MNASHCSSRTSKPRNASQFSYDGSQSSTKRVVATLANLVELLDLALERRLGAVLAELAHEGVHDRLVVLLHALRCGSSEIGHVERVSAVAVSHGTLGDRALRVAVGTTVVRVHYADTGDVESVLSIRDRVFDGVTAREDGAHAVTALAFREDDARLLSASRDRTARLWDVSVAGGVLAATYKGHDGSVETAALSTRGDRVATGAADETARLWDAASGRYLFTIHHGGGAVAAVRFSADDARLATACADGKARTPRAGFASLFLSFLRAREAAGEDGSMVSSPRRASSTRRTGRSSRPSKSRGPRRRR